ncbi:GNAT family N-acetyltransferase [Silanimonas sp.]|jgi:GNAT superfamily N-acetyltransferase|uniref:GNAT family N-acetyltransferase n=1 Tax=Silanimonas sp. TaxID=1929290 RepID=UPI0037C6BB4B
MLAMRPNCECCDTDLPADTAGAWICSFECTFCASCALGPLAGRCPNCDGGLQMRPLRVGSALARHPGSSTRVRAERAAATHVERASNPPPRLAGVRALCSEDRREWEALWEGYLAFYGSALAPSTTEATWRRLLDPSAPMFGRVAVAADGALLGFALALPHAGSWTVEPQCYLEDLFVAPGARGAGVGRALMEDLLARCRAEGWTRLYWHTQAGNAVARRLYEGYARPDDMLRYRMLLPTAYSGA